MRTSYHSRSRVSDVGMMTDRHAAHIKQIPISQIMHSNGVNYACGCEASSNSHNFSFGELKPAICLSQSGELSHPGI